MRLYYIVKYIENGEEKTLQIFTASIMAAINRAQALGIELKNILEIKRA